MKQTFIAAALVASMSSPSQLFAKGSESGNGGNVIVNDGRVRLLDLVENNNGYINPEKEPFYNDVIRKMILVVSKIEWMSSWPMQLTWVLTDSPLENIHDQGIIATTLISSIQQVAVQKDNVVLIHRPLFLKMSNKDKAALMVHELLINTAVHLGFDVQSASGTAPIRNTVALLFDDNSDAVAKSFYQNIWNTLPILPNSLADKKINKLKDVSAVNDILFTRVMNPQININGKYYPIKVEGPNLKDTFFACEGVGFHNYSYWGFKSDKLQKAVILADLENTLSIGLEIHSFPPGTEYYTEISCSNSL